jgi:hypothetical protein
MQWFAQIRKLRSLVTKKQKRKEKGESGGSFLKCLCYMIQNDMQVLREIYKTTEI